MSSSPSRATGNPAEAAALPSVPAEPFCYGEAVLRPGQTNFPLVAQASLETAPRERGAPAPDLAAQQAQWREAGRQAAVAEIRAQCEAQRSAERLAITRAVADFARERSGYYQKIEEEAVRLALSIARKILHREAQTDPLLLMGVVQVALGRIEGATGVELLVHPARAAEWRRFLAAQMDPGEAPQVVEDAAMAAEQCVLRTRMGTADLGLETQLKEIEQGLMDLLAVRPPKAL
jgi:flagellar assembly protein FliH